MKHINFNKSDLAVDVYMEIVALNYPSGKIFFRLREADKNGLHVKFRTVYHNLKNEKPFTDYPDFLNLQRFNGVLALQQTEQANSYATADAGAVFGNYIARYYMDELKTNFA